MLLKNVLYFSLLCLTTIFTVAQTIPAARRVNWENAGIHTTPPAFLDTINIINYGADATGVTNSNAALSAALAAILPNTPTLLFFPKGTYLFTTTIALPPFVVLRGVCSDSTRLNFDFAGGGNNSIQVSKSQSTAYTGITAGHTFNSTIITVANASSFNPGDYAEIRQQNGSWDTNPATWATYCVGQMVKIKAVNGNQLTLEHPLRIDYDAALVPEIRKILPIEFAGVENIYIQRIDDASAAPGGHAIEFNFAANCWAKGVESNKSVSAHIIIYSSTNVEVTGCYFHHAFEYTGSNTKGYGVCLAAHPGECLIQDNIFQYLRHSMMVKQGANGNVFAYNYSREVHRSELFSEYAGDISCHGHFPFANLFESNIVQFIQSDQYWGPTGPRNAFFRNRAENYGIIMSSGSYGSDYQSFVGNEITHAANGIPLAGQYILTGSNHFEHGNNKKGTTIPAGTNTLPDITYYNADFSKFWTLPEAYPSIGYSNNLDQGSIPAKYRWDSGGRKTTSKTSTCCLLPNSTPIVSGANINCPNDVQIYTVPAVSGSSYNWQITGGTILTGQGTNRIEVQWNVPGAGNLQIVQTIP